MKFHEMQSEFAGHVAERARELEQRGMTPSEAARQARIEFGRAERHQEQGHAAAGLLRFEGMRQDVRFGLRLLRKSPGFTVTAVLMLALGIGANAAIFSMVDWIMLRPLPVAAPGQLTYLVDLNARGGVDNGFSYPNFDDIRAQSKAVFSGVAGFVPFQSDGLTVGGATTSIWTNYVSGNFFSVVGLRPALGRFFRSGEGESEGGEPGVVLTYDIWQSRFAGRTDVIGERVAVDGRAARIIGVAPRGFRGAIVWLKNDAFLPLSMAAGGNFFHDRSGGASGVITVGRQRAGVSLAQTNAVLAVIGRRLAASYPKDDSWHGLAASRLTSEPPGASTGTVDPLMIIATLFLTLAGLVLLLACINIANLLLARAAVRQREMAVRLALGAGRARLLRQMLLESLLLAVAGGAGGLLVAWAACQGMNHLPLPASIPLVLTFGLSWHVFVYTAAVALGAGIAVGLIPAWRCCSLPPASVLHAGGRTVLGARTRLRSALVVAEIAGSLALLVVAGLFTHSLSQAEHMQLGFMAQGVEDFALDAHQAGYSETRALTFYKALLGRVRALPGVTEATVAAATPFGAYSYGAGLRIAGYPTTPGKQPEAGYNAITPGYFATLGIPLVRGRGFTTADGIHGPRVVVVNQTMARKYWPVGDAIGKTFALASAPQQAVEIVGVVADSRTDDLSSPIGAYMYLPLAQRYTTPVTLQVRSAGLDLASVATAVRQQVAQLEPAMPIGAVEPLAAGLHSLNGLFLFELGAGLAGGIGLLGLLMAVIGVYGVIAYAASQRTQEIGLRFALGAQPGQVLGLILGQGLRLTAIGVGVGLVLAAGLSAALASQLVGVGRFDPVSFVGATLLLAVVALAACLAPALRALRTDPANALRCE